MRRDLRRSLRAARRSWAKNGQIDPLRSQLESAAGAYENGAHTVARDFTMAIARAAAEFGSEFGTDVPTGDLLSAEPIAPDDRVEMAHQGKARVAAALDVATLVPARASRDGRRRDRSGSRRASELVRGGAQRGGGIDRSSAIGENRSDRGAPRRGVARIKGETSYDAEHAELAALEQHVRSSWRGARALPTSTAKLGIWWARCTGRGAC